MIKYKINVSKIKKELLTDGDHGVWLFGALFENKDGTSQYGDDGFIVQDISKEARDAGERGPIIGNWRRVKKKETTQNENKKQETPKFKHEVPF